MMFMEKNVKKTVETARLFFLCFLQNRLFQQIRRSRDFLYRENRHESGRSAAEYGENVHEGVFFVGMFFGRKEKMKQNIRKILMGTLTVIILMTFTSLIPAAAVHGAVISEKSWGADVNDRLLNLRNGTKYGCGKGQLVCTTYTGWAVRTLYGIPDYPAGGVVRTHNSWLAANARTVCVLASHADYAEHASGIRPGDIICFNDGKNFTGVWQHIAIIGGDGRTLHHAVSTGVSYRYTAEDWIGRLRQCRSARIYRLLKTAPTVTKSAAAKLTLQDRNAEPDERETVAASSAAPAPDTDSATAGAKPSVPDAVPDIGRSPADAKTEPDTESAPEETPPANPDSAPQSSSRSPENTLRAASPKGSQNSAVEEKSPDTGDTNDVFLYFSLCILACGSLCSLLYLKGRR